MYIITSVCVCVFYMLISISLSPSLFPLPFSIPLSTNPSLPPTLSSSPHPHPRSFETFFASCPAGEASNLACVVAPSHCALLDLHAWHALCNHTVPARDVRRQGGDAHKLSTRRELRDSTMVMVKAAIIDVTISLRCGTPLERHRRRALVEG